MLRKITSPIVLCLFTILASGGAFTSLAAKKTPAEAKPMPVANVCLNNKLSNRRATLWLLAKSQFPASPLSHDYNDDGNPTHTDRVMAIFDESYCSEIDPIDKRNCTFKEGTDDRQYYMDARAYLSDFFERLKSGPFKGFKYQSDVPEYDWSFVVSVTKLYKAVGEPPPKNAELSNGEDYTFTISDPSLVIAYQFMIGNSGHPKIACDEQPKKPKAEFSISKILQENLRVRGKVDDLRKKLTKDNSKEISAGSFSLVNNRKVDSTEYNIQGIIGYKLATFSDGRKDDKANAKRNEDQTFIVDLIPYLGVERRFATGKDSEEVDNISFGMDAAFNITPDEVQSYVVDLRPQFTIDSDADTKIGSLNFDIKPSWTTESLPSPNRAYWFDSFAFVTTVAGRVKGGRVFDSGGSDVIEDTQTFFRLGGHAGAQFIFITDTILDSFVPFVNYEYLYGVTGDPNNADRLETGINFTFPDLKNVQIGLKYTNGEADETFEDIEALEVQIGVKF